jgi:hypothetical protein
MSRTSYSRSELISFYTQGLPLPADFVKLPRAFQEEEILPILCQAHQTLEYHRTGAPRPDARKIHADIAPKREIGKAQPRFAHPAVQAQTGQTAPAKASPGVSWYYLDPQQTIQGPYDSDRLLRWWRKDSLPTDVRISTSNDPASFREVGTYFPDLAIAFTYNPALFPFLGPIDADPENPLEGIFCDFEAKIEAR